MARSGFGSAGCHEGVNLVRFAGLLALISVARAAAPSDLAGQVYTLSTTVTGVGPARTARVTELLLGSGGRYNGLFSEFYFAANRATSSGSIPPDGAWSYRKLTDNTGELTLNGEKNILTFTSDSGGNLPSRDVLARHTFSLTRYDTTPQLANCSNRSYVRAGGTAFTGFVAPRGGRVLIRAVGPGLALFGLSDVLRSPTLKILSAGTNTLLRTNSRWIPTDGIVAAGQRAGAFPLSANSADCALFLSLPAGNYIAEVASSDPTEAGQILIEVYMLP